MARSAPDTGETRAKPDKLIVYQKVLNSKPAKLSFANFSKSLHIVGLQTFSTMEILPLRPVIEVSIRVS